MPLSLEQFVQRVQNFRGLPDPQKIKFMTWYVHRGLGQDRVGTGDIRACYEGLHLDRPNISENLSRLNERKPRVLLKDGRGYYLEGSVRTAIDAEHLAAVQEQPVEVGDHVLPDSMVRGTKPYIEKLAWQINGCYEFKFYDGCAVLMRRLVESLLIEAFVKVGHVDKIRTGGEFMMLAGIINVAKGRQYVQFARGSDQILEDVKYVGDRAAHSRNYVSNPNDVQDLILRFRTIVAELLHVADIHPT